MIKKKSIQKSEPLSTAGSKLEQLKKEITIDLGELRGYSGKKQGAVYLLIDCSSSMAISIKQVKSGAAKYAEDAFEKGYRVGLISFASQALFHSEPLDKIEMLREKVAMLKAGGSTNMTDAINIAIEKIGLPKRQYVLCIVTDGYPNDRESAIRASRQAQQKGIDVMTVGVEGESGEDFGFLNSISSRKDLVKIVTRQQLESGLQSMAKLLPDNTK